MDFQGLIGNIGGYIGLCLGYSILQIPDFIQLLSSKFKKQFMIFRRKYHNKIDCIPSNNTQMQEMIQPQPRSSGVISNSDINGLVNLVNSLREDANDVVKKLDSLTEYVHQRKIEPRKIEDLKD